jgi:hypothetical protein
MDTLGITMLRDNPTCYLTWCMYYPHVTLPCECTWCTMCRNLAISPPCAPYSPEHISSPLAFLFHIFSPVSLPNLHAPGSLPDPRGACLTLRSPYIVYVLPAPVCRERERERREGERAMVSREREGQARRRCIGHTRMPAAWGVPRCTQSGTFHTVRAPVHRISAPLWFSIAWVYHLCALFVYLQPRPLRCLYGVRWCPCDGSTAIFVCRFTCPYAKMATLNPSRK